jgi:type IV pilus assembly protein PilA
MKQMQKGFTLIELMIVVAIIGILAAVAIPAYSNYTKKAKFSEVVQATQAIKTGIEVCFSDNGDMSVCAAGSNGVPKGIDGTVTQASITAGTASPNTKGVSATPNNGKYVDYVVVYPDTTGDKLHITITAAAVTSDGLGGDTYSLDGVGDNTKGITWGTNPNSSCLTDNFCK